MIGEPGVESGAWRTEGASCDGRIEVEVARQWDPHAVGVHLVADPRPLAADLEDAPELGDLWNLDDVDAHRCVVIADFGIGSDNPIVLDLTQEPPTVRTQRWMPDRSPKPTWITIAPSFEQFVAALGLT